MEHQLLLVSLGLTLIVTVGAFLVPAVRRGGDDLPAPIGGWRPAEIAALLLPFLGFLVTLPAQKPFAAGQGLGRGFLIGGLVSLALAWAARRTRTTVAGGATLALPVAGVTLALLILSRGILIDGLFGVAIGAFAVGFLLLVARRDDPAANPDALLAGLGATVTLASTAALGTLRDARTADLPHGTWATAMLAFVAGASLFVLVAQSIRGAAARTPDSKRGIAAATAIAALGLSAVLAALVGTKFVADKRLIAIALIGLALYPLIAWLLHSQTAANGEMAGGAQPSRLRLMQTFARSAPFLGVLLIACASMVGATLLLGYGFALTIVALYISWAAMAGESLVPNRTALRLLLFGAALVLYRAFLARWGDDLRGVDLSDQYALFGLIVGAAAPQVTALLTDGSRRGKEDGTRPLYAATVAGLLSLAVPGAVVLIFGTKCALALIVGAALSGVFSEGMTPILVTIAMSLALVQWNDYLLPYADVSRFIKLKALAVVFALAIVAVAVAAGTSRDESVTEPETDGGAL